MIVCKRHDLREFAVGINNAAAILSAHADDNRCRCPLIMTEHGCHRVTVTPVDERRRGGPSRLRQPVHRATARASVGVALAAGLTDVLKPERRERIAYLAGELRRAGIFDLDELSPPDLMTGE